MKWVEKPKKINLGMTDDVRFILAECKCVDLKEQPFLGVKALHNFLWPSIVYVYTYNLEGKVLMKTHHDNYNSRWTLSAWAGGREKVMLDCVERFMHE